MKWASCVLAYHGCDKSVAERVLSGEDELKHSKNDYDWLGEGIYFWEASPRRAFEWATLAKHNPKLSRSRVTTPAVIGAVIDLGNCLDLLEAESIQLIEESRERFSAILDQTGVQLPKTKFFLVA